MTLGLGQTIKALELGLMRVCVGEEFEITAPAEKAYGEKGKVFSKAEVVRQPLDPFVTHSSAF